MTPSPALRRSALLLATAGVLFVPALAGSAGAAEAGEGTVAVFHGVPDLPVDVYANGMKLLPDLKPGSFSAPSKVAAGEYDVDVFPTGKGPDGDPAITSKVTVPAGASVSIAAHLNAGGTPTLTTWVNNVGSAGEGNARLTVRHIAAAPTIDVRADGKVLFPAVTNGKQGSTTLPAGKVVADVALAGTDTVAIGPADLTLTAGKGTVVYAWGSAEKKTLALAVREVPLTAAPSVVPAGFGPGSDGGGIPPWSIGLAAVAAAGLAVSSRRLLAARR
ncbi:MAG: DUF4397 domain-containing protein [Sporichthyaceae bacterium]